MTSVQTPRGEEGDHGVSPNAILNHFCRKFQFRPPKYTIVPLDDEEDGFFCEVEAFALKAHGVGPSWRKAKTAAVRNLLRNLRLFRRPDPTAGDVQDAQLDYVRTLKERCKRYKVEPPRYEVLAGGPGTEPSDSFLVECSLGARKRYATDASELAARQRAAMFMLRETGFDAEEGRHRLIANQKPKRKRPAKPKEAVEEPQQTVAPPIAPPVAPPVAPLVAPPVPKRVLPSPAPPPLPSRPPPPRPLPPLPRLPPLPLPPLHQPRRHYFEQQDSPPPARRHSRPRCYLKYRMEARRILYGHFRTEKEQGARLVQALRLVPRLRPQTRSRGDGRVVLDFGAAVERDFRGTEEQVWREVVAHFRRELL